MITIDREARKSISLPSSLDRFAPRYRTDNNYFTFTSPSMTVLEKNYWYLLRNSVQKQFQGQYKMKPDYLSFDEYKTVNYAFLLMYMNGVKSIEDFDLIDVTIPSLSSIIYICKDSYPDLTPDKLSPIKW